MRSSTLKIIAIVTMLIDHIGAVLFPEVMILRIIGRLAFPIFTYLIVEGFFHTRDVKKYLIRLFIFGLISEVPFDLANFDTPLYMGYQNVFFNLALGLLAITIFERYKEKSLVLASFSLILIMVIATMFNTDYNFLGILCVFVFYRFRDDTMMKYKLFIALMTLPSILGAVSLISIGEPLFIGIFIQAFAVLAIIPIQLYNGEKGLNLKYMFYAFYPVHLLVLWAINTKVI